MERVKPRTLSGFMELLPPRQAQMEMIMSSLRESYSLYGFAPLDTPIIEAAEVLLAKGGGETEKQIYRFAKGDNDLALRFDLTVPLAKYVALHYGQLSFPFRRYQIGKVYRGERSQRGRFREFYQADIDIIGDGELGMINDAEIPAIIYRSFSRLGLRKFKIRVNNRKVLGGFFKILGLTKLSGEIMRAIDKLDKVGSEKVRKLIEDLGVSTAQADEIIRFVSISGTSAEKITALSRHLGRNEGYDQGVAELKAICNYLPEFGVPEENFEIDPAIARGLDYYTGTVYETIMENHPEIGSICSGGRYDNLAGYYTDKKLPGVGISIGLTRLFYVLEEQGLLNDDLVTAPADILVIPMTGDLGFAISAATLMRDRGLRTQIYSEEKKFRARLSYANKQNIPFVAIVGDEEIRAGKVSVKNLDTGRQLTLSPEEAARLVKEEVDRKGRGPVIKD